MESKHWTNHSGIIVATPAFTYKADSSQNQAVIAKIVDAMNQYIQSKSTEKYKFEPATDHSTSEGLAGVVKDGVAFYTRIVNDPQSSTSIQSTEEVKIYSIGLLCKKIKFGESITIKDAFYPADPTNSLNGRVIRGIGMSYNGEKFAVADQQNHRVLIWNKLPESFLDAADVVVGQPNMTMGTANNNPITGKTLYGAETINTDGTHVALSEIASNRILIWNSLPQDWTEHPDYVLGQDNFQETTANSGGLSESSLSLPRGVAWTENYLIAAEQGNNRVLIWKKSDINSNFAPASIVLGQSDFYHNQANAGGISASTLNFPEGVASDGTRLVVVDRGNHRVLIWNDITTLTNGQPADVVLGQPNFTSNIANNGGVSARSLYDPIGVFIYQGRLLVTDSVNGRLLIWNSVSELSNFAPADVVLFKSDFNTSESGLGLHTFCVTSTGRLFVPGWGTHRIYVWNSIPQTNSPTPDFYLGSTAGTSETQFKNPSDVKEIGSKLVVVDWGNNRLLIWNSIPTSSVPADIVYGQPNFTSNTAYARGTGPNQYNLNWPYDVHLTNDNKMIVSDTSNHRALIWNSIPTSNFKPADIVLGQNDFVTNRSNNNTLLLYSGRQMWTDGTRLVVCSFNSRVLIWNSIPTRWDESTMPDIVLGQSNFWDITSRTTQSGLYGPSGCVIINGKLVVADTANYRILIWNDVTNLYNGKPADVVLGQPDFTSRVVNNGGLSAKSLVLGDDTNIATDGIKLIVADRNNHRVLIWNTVPTSNFQPADVVVGQPDFTTNSAACTASKMSNPVGVYVYEGKLLVADSGNRRALIFNTIPTTNGQSADLVIGQPDFTTNSSGTTASKMGYVYGVMAANGKLVVTEGGQNVRVMIWNTFPTTNGQPADVVLLQPDFTSNIKTERNEKRAMIYTQHPAFIDNKLFVATDSNRYLWWNGIPTQNDTPANGVFGQPNFTSTGVGGPHAGSMNGPAGIDMSEDGKLFIADAWNHRVLVWNTFPTRNFQPADFVVCQPHNGSTARAVTNLYAGGDIQDVKVRFGKLFVCTYWDTYLSNRIMIWNTLPTSTGVPCDMVLGQPDFTTVTNVVDQYHTYYPTMLDISESGKLAVVNRNAHRVTIWNDVNSLYTYKPADLVLGQPDFTSSVANINGISERTLNLPLGCLFVGEKLFVTDQGNNRVLIWNEVTSNFQPADIVLGQPDFNDNSSTQEYVNAASLKGYAFPYISKKYDMLAVGDGSNYRVLIYKPIPTEDGEPAQLVLGQDNFYENTGGVINKFNVAIPYISDSGRLYVADIYNNRVLIWKNLPTSMNQPADLVLGQPDMTTNVYNYGSELRGLYQPDQVTSDGTRLVIADRLNHRVLIWNTIPSSYSEQTMESVSVVLGQPDIASNTPNNGGLSAKSLYLPTGCVIIGNKLAVADRGNNRILIWNDITTLTNFKPADVVIGQPDFTTNAWNYGGLSAKSLASSESQLETDGTKLIVADRGNNRVLIWNTVPTSNFQPANVVVGQPNFTTNSTGTTNDKMNNPFGVKVSGTKLIVTDDLNHRVLIFNSIPSSNGASANIVLGTTASAGTAANKMNYPSTSWVENNRLFVTDAGNNRVLIWNNFSGLVSGQSADVVLGQTDFVTGSGGTSQLKLANPLCVRVVAGKLLVSDSNNHRVMVWNSLPTTNGQLADEVLSKYNFDSWFLYSKSTNKSLYLPQCVREYNNRLFISDSGNHRILIFNTIPQSSYQSADIVIGQPDMTTTSNGLSDKKMFIPNGIEVVDNKLLVIDYLNHRALIWNDVANLTTYQAADLVLGQPNFNTKSSPMFTWPYQVWSDGVKVIVTDVGGARLLIWNTFPTVNNQSYDVVVGKGYNVVDPYCFIGQANSVTSDGERVFAGSWTGSFAGTGIPMTRIMCWRKIPTTNYEPADFVIGQPDLYTALYNMPIYRNVLTLSEPPMIPVEPGDLVEYAPGDLRRIKKVYSPVQFLVPGMWTYKQYNGIYRISKDEEPFNASAYWDKEKLEELRLAIQNAVPELGKVELGIDEVTELGLDPEVLQEGEIVHKTKPYIVQIYGKNYVKWDDLKDKHGLIRRPKKYKGSLSLEILDKDWLPPALLYSVEFTKPNLWAGFKMNNSIPVIVSKKQHVRDMFIGLINDFIFMPNPTGWKGVVFEFGVENVCYFSFRFDTENHYEVYLVNEVLQTEVKIGEETIDILHQPDDPTTDLRNPRINTLQRIMVKNEGEGKEKLWGIINHMELTTKKEPRTYEYEFGDEQLIDSTSNTDSDLIVSVEKYKADVVRFMRLGSFEQSSFKGQIAIFDMRVVACAHAFTILYQQLKGLQMSDISNNTMKQGRLLMSKLFGSSVPFADQIGAAMLDPNTPFSLRGDQGS